MSNWNKYRELWQQKRNELPVGSDVQADWSEMQNLLDKQMPVAHPDGKGPGGTPAPKSPFNGFGPLSIISGLIIAGLVAYFVLHTSPANTVNKNNKPDATSISKNGVPTNSNAKPGVADNTAIDAKDDHTNNNQPGSDIGAAKTADGKVNNTANDKANSKADNDNAIATANSATNGNNKVSNVQPNLNPNIGNNSAANRLYAGKYHANSSAGGRSLLLGNLRSAGDNTYRNNSGRIVSANGLASSQDKSRGGNNKTSADQQYSGAGQDISGPYNTDAGKIKMLKSPASLQLRWEDIVTGNLYPDKLPYPVVSITRSPIVKSTSADKRSSTSKNKKTSGNAADIDWGILVGVNTNGSFTTKELNHNLYGSLGVDPYLGLFANGNIDDHWSTAIQIKALVPHMVKGGYTHANDSKVDTGQVFNFKDLRKIYTVDIPLQAIYHVTPNFNLKGGPVISIPVKQTGGTNTFEKGPERDDSGYYTQVEKALDATDFSKKIQVGASAGVGVAYKFLSLDATYNYQLQSQKINSSLGSYATKMNNLQITLGIQLNKKKK